MVQWLNRPCVLCTISLNHTKQRGRTLFNLAAYRTIPLANNVTAQMLTTLQPQTRRTDDAPRSGAILACSGSKWRQNSRTYPSGGIAASCTVNLADLSHQPPIQLALDLTTQERLAQKETLTESTKRPTYLSLHPMYPAGPVHRVISQLESHPGSLLAALVKSGIVL